MKNLISRADTKNAHKKVHFCCNMKSKLILFSLLICLCITTVFASEIDKKIYEELKSKEEVSVIIKLKDTDNNANNISNSNYEQRLRIEKDRIHKQQERFLEDIEKINGKFSLQTQEKLLKIERLYSTLNFISAKISYGGIERLKDNPFVEKIYYNEIRKIFLDNSNPKINASLVWGLVYNSTNITGKYETICVIDTGVDYGHPNLGNCTNTTFLAGNCSRIIAGYDNVNNDYNPIDDHGHGTHVTGIIISNDSTYKGIAPGASIVSLKACNSGGSCSDQDITESIDWCINNKTRYNISIISMSLGGGSYSSNCDGTSAPVDSVNNAANLGFFVAIASGNDGSTNAISSPACASNVTAVGGINTDDASMIYNRAPFISIIAPAVSITSTVPKSGGTHNSATGFKALSGTSMATPHISATAALILQYKKLEQGKNLTFQQIEDAMNTTGKSINETGTIYRRINSYKALLSLDNATPTITFTFPTPTNATNTTNSSILINISANEVLSIAILEFNNTNTTMNGSTMSWFFNKTTLNNGVFNYRVFGNDSAGNMGVSEVRRIQINNTAPNITTIYPNYTIVNISEPNNQTFNITYTDIDGDSLTIIWYQNNSVVSNSNNYTFIGNYSTNGVYNITVIISD
ncbi:MAG: S8 family serine peptidase, partial [Nanoarchaeota archaeon]